MGEHAKRAHAMHNASSADWWLECGLWYQWKKEAEAKGEVYDKPGEAAKRGTMMHEQAEVLLLNILDQGEEAIDDWRSSMNELTKEEKDWVVTAVEAVMELVDIRETEVETEVAIPLSHEPESDGHVDVLAYQEGCLFVIDYKFGEMQVAPSSPQLKIYGANALVLLRQNLGSIDPDMDVVLAVVQPRIHREALVRRYKARDLLKFQAHVEHVVHAQLEGAEKRGAGSLSVCEWCPWIDRCWHRKALLGGMIKTLRKVELSNEEIEDIVRARSALKKTIEKYTKVVAEDEDRFPNWTRVHVSNGRVWNPALDVSKVATQLIDAGAEEVYALRSPAQIRDSNRKLKPLVEKLSIDSGFHVRLYEGAPVGAPKDEPPKRPVKRAVVKKTKGNKKR